MSRRSTPPFAAEADASGLEPYSGCRRRSPRARCRKPAELTLASGAKLAGRIEQVSETGVLFVARAAVPEAESTELRFPEPTAGRIVLVRAVCRWSRVTQNGMFEAGLEFSAVPSPPVDLLRQYVALTRSA